MLRSNDQLGGAGSSSQYKELSAIADKTGQFADRISHMSKLDEQFFQMISSLPESVHPEGTMGKYLAGVIAGSGVQPYSGIKKISIAKVDWLTNKQRMRHVEMLIEHDKLSQLVKSNKLVSKDLRDAVLNLADKLLQPRLEVEQQAMLAKTIHCLPYILSINDMAADVDNKEADLYSMLTLRGKLLATEWDALRNRSATAEQPLLSKMKQEFATLNATYREVTKSTRETLDVWDFNISCHSDEKLKRLVHPQLLSQLQQSHITLGRAHASASFLGASLLLGTAELDAIAGTNAELANRHGKVNKASVQIDYDMQEVGGALRQAGFSLMNDYQALLNTLPAPGTPVSGQDQDKLCKQMTHIERQLATLEAKCNGFSAGLADNDRPSHAELYGELGALLSDLARGTAVSKLQFGYVTVMPPALRDKRRGSADDVTRKFGAGEPESSKSKPSKKAAAASVGSTAGNGDKPAHADAAQPSPANTGAVKDLAIPMRSKQPESTSAAATQARPDPTPEIGDAERDMAEPIADIDDAEMAAKLNIVSGSTRPAVSKQAGLTNAELIADLDQTRQQMAQHHNTMMNPFHPKPRRRLETMDKYEVNHAIKLQNTARVMHGLLTDQALGRLSQLVRRATPEARGEWLAQRESMQQLRREAELASCKSPALVTPNAEAYRILVNRGEVTKLTCSKEGLTYQKAGTDKLPARFNMYDVVVVEVKSTVPAPSKNKRKGKAESQAVERSVPWGHYHYHYEADPDTKKPILNLKGEKQYILGVGFFKPMAVAFMGEGFERHDQGENSFYVTRVQMPATDFFSVSQAIPGRD